MTQQQRLAMLSLSSQTIGGYPGNLLDLGLGSMLAPYLVPIAGSDRFCLRSAPHRQIVQVGPHSVAWESVMLAISPTQLWENKWPELVCVDHLSSGHTLDDFGQRG